MIANNTKCKTQNPKNNISLLYSDNNEIQKNNKENETFVKKET
jgi:hypothetical protein